MNDRYGNADRRIAMWPRWMKGRKGVVSDDGTSDYHELVVLRWPCSSFTSPTNGDGPMRPDQRQFEAFSQRMVSRLMVGWVNGYGLNRRYRYLTRLTKELFAYLRTGNKEHLVNIANYAYLEFERPEHPLARYDPYAATVTGGCGLGDRRGNK